MKHDFKILYEISILGCCFSVKRFEAVAGLFSVHFWIDLGFSYDDFRKTTFL